MKNELKLLEKFLRKSLCEDRNLQGEAYASAEEDSEEPPKKKRYAEGRVLDQTDCKFGIRIEDDEVLLMSDESELSSLNEVEYDHVRRAFDKVCLKTLLKC